MIMSCCITVYYVMLYNTHDVVIKHMICYITHDMYVI